MIRRYLAKRRLARMIRENREKRAKAMSNRTPDGRFRRVR